jgi:hypothetical protein
MTSPSHNKREELRQQLHRLIIEWRNELGFIAPDEQRPMANEIMQLIATEQRSLLTRVKEGRPDNRPDTGWMAPDGNSAYNIALKAYDAHIDRIAEEL